VRDRNRTVAACNRTVHDRNSMGSDPNSMVRDRDRIAPDPHRYWFSDRMNWIYSTVR
jgi:hypothetical protein